jgi:hypothetical protein
MAKGALLCVLLGVCVRPTLPQSFIGEYEFSASNFMLLALFALWFFIRAM